MSKVKKSNKEGFYSYEGDKYKTEIKSTDILVLKSLDAMKVLIIDNNLSIIGDVTFTQVDYYTPMLEVENYQNQCNANRNNN